MTRHARLSDIAADVVARIQALKIFADATAVAAIRAVELEQVVAAVQEVWRLPCCLVTVGASEYMTDSPRRRTRETRIGCVVAGEYDAGRDAGAADVWDLVDAIDRSFQAPGGTAWLVINGVTYIPNGIEPVPAGANRTCYALVLRAIDPVTDGRTDV